MLNRTNLLIINMISIEATLNQVSDDGNQKL